MICIVRTISARGPPETTDGALPSVGGARPIWSKVRFRPSAIQARSRGSGSCTHTSRDIDGAIFRDHCGAERDFEWQLAEDTIPVQRD